MIEEVYLGADTILLEGRSQLGYEWRFLLPRHVERCAVGLVERLVLRRNGIDIDALLLHGSNELNEVLGIVLTIVRIQVTVGPRVERLLGVDIRNLHPFRTSPRSSDNLHVGIDSQNLLQNRDDILSLVAVETEVIESRLVAERILCR